MHRAHGHPLRQPVTHHLGGQAVNQRGHGVGDAVPVHVEPLDRHADLPAGDEGGVEQAAGQGGVDLDVGGQDGRVISPELQHDRPRRAGGRSHHGLPGGHAAGERDHVHLGMAGQGGAQGGIGPVDHVQHPGREHLGHGGGHQEDGPGAGRRGFDHDGVAGQQRREDLVGHHRDRPVERQDGPHHAMGHPLHPGRAGLVHPAGQRLGRHRREAGGHRPHGAGIEERFPVDLAVLAGEQAGQIAPFHGGHAGLAAAAITKAARSSGRLAAQPVEDRRAAPTA